MLLIGYLNILILSADSKTIKFQKFYERQHPPLKTYYLDDVGDLKFREIRNEKELMNDQYNQQIWNKPNVRKILWKKLMDENKSVLDSIEFRDLSEEKKLQIEETINHNFISLLKQLYAISSRSRLGR